MPLSAKISLSGRRNASVEFSYGQRMMDHLRNAPGVPHSETTCRITVKKGKTLLGTVEGKSYCSPTDHFDQAFGNRLAIQRAFANDQERKILLKDDRARIAQEVIVPIALCRKCHCSNL